MKINNSEILDQVKEKISEKKVKIKEKVIAKKENSSDFTESKSEDNKVFLENELKKWIEKNAENIAKDIIKQEVRKIFK